MGHNIYQSCCFVLCLCLYEVFGCHFSFDHQVSFPFLPTGSVLNSNYEDQTEV